MLLVCRFIAKALHLIAPEALNLGVVALDTPFFNKIPFAGGLRGLMIYSGAKRLIRARYQVGYRKHIENYRAYNYGVGYLAVYNGY